MWYGKNHQAKNVTDSCKVAWDRAVEKTSSRIGSETKDLLQVVEGDKTEAEWMADDNRINLLSAH